MPLSRSGFSDVSPAVLAAQPLERAETMPSAWYTEPRFFELDREVLFARTWQQVGHVSRVREPGDYLVASVAGYPIIVVRGKDEILRAFYNVCRHRGGPLATEDGSAKALKCKYHGWTYLLDGSLRGVPKFDRVELFDRKDYGLIPVNVDIWQGLVFVNLSGDCEPLATYFEGIVERIAPTRLDTLQFHRRMDYELRSNWKVYVDNYVEGYHVPHVHPELFKIYDFQNYATEVNRYHSVQHSPLGEGDKIYGGVGNHAFYYCVYPNFMMNILPGRLQTNLVVPVAPNRTLVVFEYYYEDIASPAAKAKMAEDVAFSDAVQVEDVEICDRVQEGLASPAYDRGRFSVEYEEAVFHFHSYVRDAYRAWLTE